MTATDATSDADDPPADFEPAEEKPSASTKPRKSTNAVVAQRVEEILRIRLDGAAFADIRDCAVQNGWGLSDSQLKKLIQKSDALLKERHERGVSRTFRLHIARRESLYARSAASADFRTALAVLSDMAKVEGLYFGEKEWRELTKGLQEARADITEACAVNDSLRMQLEDAKRRQQGTT